MGAKRTSAELEALARMNELGEAELLAEVTGLDTEQAHGLLAEYGGLRAVLQQPEEVLIQQAHLSAENVRRLHAALALSRRALHSQLEPRPRLGTPDAIYQYAQVHFLGARREEFHVLCLNSRNVLLRHCRVAVGSVDQCHIDPREALAPALAVRASGLVLLHNHPTGDPEPSTLDVTLTQQLREGARLLCLKLLDHLVLGQGRYVSLAARGLLQVDSRGFSLALSQ